MTSTLDTLPPVTRGRPRRRPRWTTLALPVAAAWSVLYLGLGIAWLVGAPGNPADPTVDEQVRELGVLGLWSAPAGAALLAGCAGLGVLCAAGMVLLRPGRGVAGAVRRVATVTAFGLGLVLAVVLPDYRLLATIGYVPILLVLWIFRAVPEGADIVSWPMANLALLSVAGLAWVMAAVVSRRQDVDACVACGRSGADPARTAEPGTTAAGTAWWGRWAVVVAVAVPVGYAITRFAWALGIPLGVGQELLDELGNGVYAGAALSTLAVGGAVLTLGLIQGWGEVFPRWMIGLRGRRVPIALAVVPAGIVSVVVTSAGVMFVRMGLAGRFAVDVPGGHSNVAAWLPQMFGPLWGVALAAATYAYWLRRRGACDRCGNGGRHVAS
jgi:hypothetical protein